MGEDSRDGLPGVLLVADESKGRHGRRTARASRFALAAKIVENARSRLMNAYRRTIFEG
jgi:hypothetical protein